MCADDLSDTDIQQQIAKERRAARRAAKAFADVCAAGDFALMQPAAQLLNEHDGWLLAMKRVARLKSIGPEIQAAFLSVWIESKGFLFKVDDRQILSSAFRILFPCDYRGKPLSLYRGAMATEHERKEYGFSWTIDKDMATNFASRVVQEKRRDAVVLETLAPPHAVLLVREKEDFFDEGEVVLDPFSLDQVDATDFLNAAQTP